MVYFYLRLLLVCGVAMMTSGCATVMLNKYASRVEVRDHRIAEVISASRTAGGAILMCVTGWPAKRDRGTRPVAFSVTFPLSLFENESETPPVLSGGDESIASYRLAPERMGEACPKDPADTDDIPVRRVDRQYFGGNPPTFGLVAVVGPFLDDSEPGAMVYVLGAGDPMRRPLVVYQHTEPIFRGSRWVAITLPSETVKPNRTAYAALPFALVVDIAAGAVIVVTIAFIAFAIAV